MTTHLLSRTHHRPRPSLSLAGDITLALTRVHECCGLARRSFAMWLAGRMQGPVFWITPAWGTDAVYPPGMTGFADPGRFTFVTPKRPEDLLWTMEEVLRTGAVPLVVGDIPGLPGLTQVRRMHLAAETGADEGEVAPLGLLLTPGEGGAQGVESRWSMTPAHEAGGAERWCLTRLRARTDPQKSWTVTRGPKGLRLGSGAGSGTGTGAAGGQ